MAGRRRGRAIACCVSALGLAVVSGFQHANPSWQHLSNQPLLRQQEQRQEAEVVGQVPRESWMPRLHRLFSTALSAKKKKGPAADALAALEALEAQEGADAGEAAIVVDTEAEEKKKAKMAKKEAKKAKKGPAADALAAVEAIEAAEALEALENAAAESDSSQAPPGKKKGKKAKKGPAADALAALEAMEAMEESSHQFLADTGDNIKAGSRNKKDKKNKKDKGKGKKKNVAADEQVVMPQKELKGDKTQRVADKAEDLAREEDQQAEEEETIGVRAQGREEKVDDVGYSAESFPVEGVEEEEEEGVTLEERVRKGRPAPRVQIAESSQPGFVSLRLDGVSVVFKNQEVLKDATWEVKTGDRVGLVGANGCGKTTQVKILAGDIDATTGDVVKSSKDLRVAFLRQEFTDELDPERTLRMEFSSVFAEASAALQELSEAERRLEALSSKDASEEGYAEVMQEVLDDMARLQDKADRLEAYSIDAKVDKVVDTMGFMPEETDAKVRSFSGGWKMRIGLGKILLQDPNILLLDEPTNHLDLESVEWLEKFLVQQNIPMVIVSHDREFLDQVCTKIVDTQEGVTQVYNGCNYSRFLKLKKARMDAWKSAYDTQQKKIKEERNWINQNKNKPSSSSTVKQRQAKLDKLLKGEGGDELVERPPNDKRKFRFRFPTPPRCGVDELAEIDGVTHGYPGNLLFEGVDLTVEPNDRIAFLGPNGAGKSTLLRCLVGKEAPTEGTASIGERVVYKYFEQNQADALNLEDTVIGVIEKASTTESYEQLRALLGQFLFKGNDVEKKIKNLSGGEKARVALCRMMLEPANLLVLDEPTNHLDIPAKEMLEEALQNYEGSMLLISHDRYFISQVATTIIAIEDKSLEMYSGDYKYYMDNRPEVKEKVQSRFVSGDGRKLGNAVVIEPAEDKDKKKKNFGGGGGPSGKKDKGVKNAKRMK